MVKQFFNFLCVFQSEILIKIQIILEPETTQPRRNTYLNEQLTFC